MNNNRQDFSILKTKANGQPLVYLDNAATTQKPTAVIEAMTDYYKTTNANVHRGIHFLSEQATTAYEGARQKVADFIKAKSAQEVIYTRGTTESINLVAATWGRQNIKAGDEIILAVVNHHSNIVPWQMLAKEKGAVIKWWDCDARGDLGTEELKNLLTSGKVKLVALTHISNTLGTVYDVKPWIKMAHQAGALVMLDAAQSSPHMPLDVKDLDCDWLAFSGHKMLGPTGIGILYGRRELLEKMPPYQGGGDMIMTVDKEGFSENHLPWKFEAGTPNIAGAIGLGSAIDYLNKFGLQNIKQQEEELTAYCLEQLKSIEQVKVYGPQDPTKQIGVVSFNISGIHPHDVAAHLDSFGVAVRAGNHCTQPLHQALGINASVRASFYFYNTTEEIDVLIKAIKDCIVVYR